MNRLAAVTLTLLLLAPLGGAQAEEIDWEEYEEEGTQLKLLELNGYLRLRADLFHNLHLRGNSSFPEPLTEVLEETTDEGITAHPRARDADTRAGANLRFRLEPTINVTEEVRILTQIDILDNLVLGSTPNTYGTSTPSALSDSQTVASDGVSALRDSLRVKRVWGEVITQLGQLRFGRMPLHWGLGMLYNDGNCLECDQGTTVDRVDFVVKIADHYFIPSWDFGAEGPADDGTRSGWENHPIDMDQLDDVNQFTLVIARRDSDREIEEALNNDEWIFNYGLFTVYRLQSLSLDIIADPETDPTSVKASDMVERDFEAWTWDLWGKFIWRDLRLEAEFAVVWGSMDERGISGNLEIEPESDRKVDLLQFGFVAEGSYSLLADALHIGLTVAYASGDTAEGFGAQDPMSQVSEIDDELTNFRFAPDFHVDRILWREMVGRITDALVIRPSVAYTITSGLGVELDAIYSVCEKANSSPGDEFNLGLELDASVFYISEQGFFANLTYGIFFPFDGFDRVLEESDNGEVTWGDPGIAHAVQLHLGIRF